MYLYINPVIYVSNFKTKDPKQNESYVIFKYKLLLT